MTDLPATKQDPRQSALRAHIINLLKGNVPPTRVHEWLLRSGISSVALSDIKSLDETIPDSDRLPLDPLGQLLKLKPGEDIGFDPVFEMIKVLMLQRQRFEAAIDPMTGVVLDPKIVAFERNAYWFLLKDFIEITELVKPNQQGAGNSAESGSLPSRGDMATRLRARLENDGGKVIMKEIQRTVELYDKDDDGAMKDTDLKIRNDSYKR